MLPSSPSLRWIVPRDPASTGDDAFGRGVIFTGDRANDPPTKTAVFIGRSLLGLAHSQLTSGVWN